MKKAIVYISFSLLLLTTVSAQIVNWSKEIYDYPFTKEEVLDAVKRSDIITKVVNNDHGIFPSIQPLENDEFLIVNSLVGFNKIKYRVINSSFEDIQISEIPIDGEFLQLVKVKSKLLLLSTKENNGNLELLANFFNAKTKTFEEVSKSLGTIKLIDAEIQKTINLIYNFSLSDDSTQIGIYLSYRKNSNSKENEWRHEFISVNLTNNFSLIQHSGLSFPKDKRKIEFKSYCINNNGEFLAAFTEELENRPKKDWQEELSFYLLKNNVEPLKIKPQSSGLYLKNSIISSRGSEFEIFGYYTQPKEESENKGVYYLGINRLGNQTKFDKYFLKEDYFEAIDSRAYINNNLPQKILTVGDTSIFISEIAYSESYSSYGTKNYRYDIYLYAFVKGKLLWKRKIPKKQIYTNALYSSFSAGMINNKINIVYTECEKATQLNSADLYTVQVNLLDGKLGKTVKIGSNENNKKIMNIRIQS